MAQRQIGQHYVFNSQSSGAPCRFTDSQASRCLPIPSSLVMTPRCCTIPSLRSRRTRYRPITPY
ncbi:hypothetical protein JG688_00013169 [Phytophthora aleatoria]|uniref:Uncharacterized protein n=1 Tax=Phytophthora aleatoria TaxID=2496075 RepID=A0A8J5II60_9STRA|nr:hypothetical protein JG688_00013169 [Phytophthora aleatoria]